MLPYGHDKAKVSADFIKAQAGKADGNLILVTAINPTPAGEGKTTTTVGLGDGLNAIGKNAMICIREASLGPNFGMKGGAAGGGYAQVVPMEDMNLHFTGDFHAITSAHNLLSAMIDNHIYWGNSLEIDTRRVAWRRVVDMNDRALRQITASLGGVANGFPREAGFDITVASEVMAILCLANDLADLEERLGNMIVAYRRDRSPVYCRDIQAAGAMAVLLKDAVQPNLVQTLENNPAFVHGGPFANIAHGCNSVVATKTALKLADYVVTEAGFGADLGAEKFMNIKCRKAGLSPKAVVIVATVRALKMNGGVARADLGEENVQAVKDAAPTWAGMSRTCRNTAFRRLSASTTSSPTPMPRSRRSRITWPRSGRKPSFASTGPRDPKGPRIWPPAWSRSSTRARRPISRSMATTSRWPTRSTRSARKIYRADGAVMDKKILDQLKQWEDAGYGTCRSVWRRPNTPSPPTRPSAARRPGSTSPCVKSACRRAPGSSSRSAERS